MNLGIKLRAGNTPMINFKMGNVHCWVKMGSGGMGLCPTVEKTVLAHYSMGILCVLLFQALGRMIY
jgi:hypothetical protein